MGAYCFGGNRQTWTSAAQWKQSTYRQNSARQQLPYTWCKIAFVDKIALGLLKAHVLM